MAVGDDFTSHRVVFLVLRAHHGFTREELNEALPVLTETIGESFIDYNSGMPP